MESFGASLRYLSQRFGMPDKKSKAILNDVGTEELAHLEMVGTMVHQLTDGVSPEELSKVGLGPYYTDHRLGSISTICWRNTLVC